MPLGQTDPRRLQEPQWRWGLENNPPNAALVDLETPTASAIPWAAASARGPGDGV